MIPRLNILLRTPPFFSAVISIISDFNTSNGVLESVGAELSAGILTPKIEGVGVGVGVYIYLHLLLHLKTLKYTQKTSKPTPKHPTTLKKKLF